MKLWTKYRKFAGGSLGLMTSGLLLTTTAIIGWKWGVSPILKKKKRKQAEEFADYIYEERRKKLIDNVQQ